MTSLRYFIDHHRLDETDVLNMLQGNGVISDECVTVEDVGDAGKAVAWLILRMPKLKTIPKSSKTV
jgi:hypothetical protein